MSSLRILDLFCGAGGAAKGYHDGFTAAGFDVEIVGVDIALQPNYPYEFYQADAMALERDMLDKCWHENGAKSSLPGRLAMCLGHFDLIHASPPCQAYSDLAKRNGNGNDWPQLIEPIRLALIDSGLPYVIENVEGAPLLEPVTLCGTQFPGLRVLRHRLFESNVPLTAPPHGKHPLVFTHDKRKAHYGQLDQDTSFVQVTGGGNCTVANKRDAMGIDWMTGAELNEAIPPAYTAYLAGQIASAL